MNSFQNYVIAFMEGYMCAVVGEQMINGNVAERVLDDAKHAAERCVENRIEQSNLPEEQKDLMKANYKIGAESVLQGMKKRLRENGRLI